jgi:site-specific recombinase XerD
VSVSVVFLAPIPNLMKNAGVSEAVAQEFIGHESAAMNDKYTHIDMSALRQAAETMPDILI